jgi:hypothetical protein
MALAVQNPTSPSYLTRQDINLGNIVAGSGGVTPKFAAHAALLLFSVNTITQVLGTSTYTANGTGTGSGQQIYVAVVANTNTTGTAVSLATTSYGPFVAGGQGLSTAAVGGYNQWQLNTTTGTGGYGGVPVPQGALVYCISGTDATAVTNCTLDYVVAPQAPLTQ